MNEIPSLQTVGTPLSRGESSPYSIVHGPGHHSMPTYVHRSPLLESQGIYGEITHTKSRFCHRRLSAAPIRHAFRAICVYQGDMPLTGLPPCRRKYALCARLCCAYGSQYIHKTIPHYKKMHLKCNNRFLVGIIIMHSNPAVPMTEEGTETIK